MCLNRNLLFLGLILAPASATAEPAVLTLSEAREEALRLHPTLDEYRSRIAQARYKVEEAYVPARPTAQIRTGYTYLNPIQTVNFLGRNLAISQANNYDATATLQWTLLSFGRLKWGTLAAELSERTAREEYRREQLRAWEEVSLAYYDLAQQADQLRVAQAEVAVQRKSLADAQIQEQAGAVAHFDVLRSQATLTQSQQNLLVAESNRTVSRANLASLLNKPTGYDFQVEELAVPPQEQVSLQPSIDFAFDHRPDLVAYEWSVKAAQAQVGAAASENAPSLGMQGQYVNQNSTAFQLGQQWSAGLTLTFPVYDGGLSSAHTKEAKESLRQLLDNRELLRRQAAVEVETLFHQLRTTWQQIIVNQDQLMQNREAERVAALRYNNGLGTQLELLDSQRQRIASEQALIAARYQYLGALTRWKRSLGQELPGVTHGS